MGVLEGVHAERWDDGVRGEPVKHLVLGEEVIDADVLHQRGETLVEIEAVPPPHGHEITEPLVAPVAIVIWVAEAV